MNASFIEENDEIKNVPQSSQESKVHSFVHSDQNEEQDENNGIL